MEKVMSFIKGLLVFVWAIIAIITTMLLISYNDFSVSEIGDFSLFIVDNERLEPDYFKHDIVIVEKVAENKYSVDDYAFFYLSNPIDEVFINYGQISNIEAADHAADTYYFGNDAVSYENMMGPAKGAIVIPKIGLLLSILESRWGFMFLIILPTLFAIVYEIYSIVEEVKAESTNDEE